MTNIKQLAGEYLSTENEAEKAQILQEAKQAFKALEYTTPNKLLKELGLTYFCGVNSSSKVEKGLKYDIDTLILYLSASDNAGHEICPHKSIECALICLVESGRAAMEKPSGRIHVARLVKTWLVRYRKVLAYALIQNDINKAKRRGRGFAVRLNGTSDLNWGVIIQTNPDVAFYDYTKNIAIAMSTRHVNHHVTFSFSGHNHEECKRARRNGKNIAVACMPEDFKRALSLPNVYSGDDTDLRFMDKQEGQICLLKVKGRNVQKNVFVLDYNEVKEMAK